jgi:hypothetical protein
MMPVIPGIILAPKNRNSHMKIQNAGRLETSGTGMALRAAKDARNHDMWRALLPVYPPFRCMM